MVAERSRTRRARPTGASDTGRVVAVKRGATTADFGWALGAVFRSYQDAARDAVIDLPGGPRGYQVLVAAARDEPRTQLALAQHLGVDRTVMTYLLDDLEGADLIERLADPNDRRVRHIGITAAGSAQLAVLDERLLEVDDVVLAALTPAERRTFTSMIARLAAPTE